MPRTYTIQEALASARDTRLLRLGPGVLQELPSVFSDLFSGRDALIVADQNTFKVAGMQVFRSLRATGIRGPDPFVFSEPCLYAEHGYVEELTQQLSDNGAIPVAVGSGTINDLTKLAAHRAKRPYLCVATAASMDGYAAYGASITHNGSKQTFFCPAPAGVIADLEVISNAPAPMNSWGYADFLAKVPAGADWLVADALGVERLDTRAWEIVQGRLRELLQEPAGLRTPDWRPVARLLEGLLLCGFAMQSTQSSRPASGAEHQFSHLWDMQHLTHKGGTPSHGFKVGIGTLATTALYHFLLEQPLENLDVETCVSRWADAGDWAEQARFKFSQADLRMVAETEVTAKYASPDTLRAQLHQLRSVWPALRETLRTQLYSLPEVKASLLAAGAPTEPEQIGISRQRLRDSYWLAFFIRRRFTVLDLAARTGLLGPALEHLFGASGPWPIAGSGN